MNTPSSVSVSTLRQTATAFPCDPTIQERAMSTSRPHVSLDRAIAELATRQHGAFTREQAIALGASRGVVARRVESGRWTRRHPGVFLIGGVPHTWATELSAAVLARPGALVSHQAGAVLHRMRFVERRVVAISDDRPHWAGLAGVEVHRPRRLTRERATVVDGFPVTDRASTVVDLASVVGAGRLGRVLDDQLTSHRIALPDMILAFDQQARRGKKGIANLRAVLEERSGGVAATRSDLEQRFRTLVLAEVPVPATFEFLPPWRSDGIGRADCAFPTHRVLAEVDGRRWHLRDQDHEADLRRDQEALEHDWRTVRYSYRQVTENPASVVANLLRILELGVS